VAVVVIRWGLAMVDVAAYMGAGAVLLDSGLNPFAYGFEDTAQNGPTSLVKPYSGNVNIGKHKGCPDSPYFQEICSDGCWQHRRRPCGKWGCVPCREYRIKHELVPEVVEALKWARSLGLTLKHIILTGAADDILTEASPEGSEARRSGLGKFKQSMTRQGKAFEYLRVAESHKSGRVHLHLLAVTPYIAQRELQKRWGFRAWVSAVGLRCPRCYPGRGASAKAKRLSTIVPPPGKGYCGKCGYTVDWDNPYNWAAVAEIVALEMSKYLTKEASMAGVRKRMNRSRAWGKRCQVKPDKVPVFCSECADEHAFRFVGPSARIEVDYPGVNVATTAGVAYYPAGGKPCRCWGNDKDWVESVSPRASSGLVDHMPLFNWRECSPGPPGS
jgi:hypothetical protein